MKKTLIEEINRIHEITYGKQIVNEQDGGNWLNRILGGSDDKKNPEQTKKMDDPKKADLVSDDLSAFYKNLEDASKSGGLSQQTGSGLTFQKGVESMQIGLMALGYDLPQHGVDGLFGPETATAVNKFTSEKLGGVTSKPTKDNTNPQSEGTKATPEMLTKLIELLKNKPLTSEELKKYIDSVLTGGAGFTDLDLSTDEGFSAYAEICQKFIDRKQPNPLEITGVMMATSAKNAFTNHHKYIPPELALAQMAAEGGIGNGNLQSRPIRTRNPFNVGNVDSGANVQHGSVQSGIDAYYNLIARNYLVKGKTAADLVKNFVNKDNQRYASGTEYETAVANLAGQANRIAAPIYASLSNKMGNQDTSNIA